MTKPDMRDYFRGRIAWHTHGLLAGNLAPIPPGVRRVSGDVTDPIIVVVMDDGTEYRFTGGRYAARKVNGCYAPLMPKAA